MKIVIDSRFWGPGHTGLGVYTKQLVTNLEKIDSKNHYYLLIRPGFPKDEIRSKNFSLVEVNAAPYTFKEQIILGFVLLRLRPSVAHFPSINAPLLCFSKTVVTIHDLIKHHSVGTQTSTLPAPVYWFKYLIYRFLIFWLVNISDKIIIPSETVRKNLVKNYPKAEGKYVVTLEAAVINPHIQGEKISLPAKFAIYTGNAYPHKNLPFLISVWKDVFEKTQTKLVLVCGRTVFATRIEQMVKEISAQNWVEFKGYLTDEQLAFAYRQATAYVFPTLMEGFGIPGLDAMNFGLPVLCSDIPILREIYDNAALYFDPTDKNDLIVKATSLITSPEMRKKYIALGKSRVKRFSWEKLAKETLRVYEDVIAS